MVARKQLVITGATSGIGRTVALQLAAQGYNVTVVGRSAAKGDDLAAAIAAADSDCVFKYHVADLSSLADVKRVAAHLADAHPVVDVLINNAGGYVARKCSRSFHRLSHFCSSSVICAISHFHPSVILTRQSHHPYHSYSVNLTIHIILTRQSQHLCHYLCHSHSSKSAFVHTHTRDAHNQLCTHRLPFNSVFSAFESVDDTEKSMANNHSA
jgi:NAD(P)-dependent dehydrogenase (short-subunit alcohol dehydrogenase family)